MELTYRMSREGEELEDGGGELEGEGEPGARSRFQMEAKALV